MSDIEKQFAGNYVRLVNKSRSLEQDVILKDKIIKNLQDYISILTNNPCEGTNKTAEFYRQLVAEQNKKAAGNASI